MGEERCLTAVGALVGHRARSAIVIADLSPAGRKQLPLRGEEDVQVHVGIDEVLRDHLVHRGGSQAVIDSLDADDTAMKRSRGNDGRTVQDVRRSCG